MAFLTRAVIRSRWLVIALWLLAIAGVQVAATTLGSDYRNELGLPGTDSQAAVDLLEDRFDDVSGATDRIAWEVDSGSAIGSRAADVIEPVLEEVAELDGVVGVQSPFLPQGAAQVSDDDGIAYAVVQYDAQPVELDRATLERIAEEVEAANAADGIVVGVGGQGVAELSAPEVGPTELIGVAFAAVVLLLALGSVTAMLLPILSAGVALGVSLGMISLLSRTMPIADATSTIGVLLGLGVGIDYALFIVNRYRSGLLSGLSVDDALAAAVTTSGRAVIFAGITVCIALAGMIVPGIAFLYGIAIGAAVAVAFTVLSAITFLPALLRILGTRVLGRRRRRALAAGETTDEHAGRIFSGLASTVSRRPVVWTLAGVLGLSIIALPVLDLRLGTADQALNPDGSTTRVAYDLLADGFGDGVNGTIIVAVDASDDPIELPAPPSVPAPGDAPAPGSPPQPPVPEELADLRLALDRDTGTDAVIGPILNGDGTAAIFQVIADTSPQATETEELIDRIRDDIAPDIEDDQGVEVHVGGAVATFADFADEITAALPSFFAFVIGLSFLLLVFAFRSLLVPLVGAVLNLLSAAAAFGVIVAVFQWGWGTDLIGVGGGGPIEPFVPVVLFAILFGLSTDYQVFLVSRISEEWHRRGDNTVAVRIGHAETGRVIVAASLIMVAVFGAFVGIDARTVKLIGLGLAVAVLLDALVIRMIVVPAVMRLLGRSNWWLPGWLDRVLPRFSVEGNDTSVSSLTSSAGSSLAVATASGSGADEQHRHAETAPPRLGYEAGYEAGFEAEINRRYEEGYAEGYAAGEALDPEARWRTGYEKGLEDALRADAAATRPGVRAAIGHGPTAL